jgi:hypothetical protein
VQRPVPATSGYSSVWSNVGTIRNRGVDLGLRTVNVDMRGGRINWTTDFNVTWNRNMVTDLYRAPGDTVNAPILFGTRSVSAAARGQPLGSYYLFNFLHVDSQTGNAVYSCVVNPSVPACKAVGSSGRGETFAPVSADRQYVGNPQPNYYGGLTNSFTLGNFDLRGFLQFSQGNDVMRLTRIFMDDGGRTNDNKSANVLRRWRKPGDITDVPRMGANSGANQISSRFVEDGSFVRLGELTLGYRVPAGLTRLVRMDDARLYVSGRNLKTWTKYSGYNPDVNSNASSDVAGGVDYYAYPLARTFTLGITAGW